MFCVVELGALQIVLDDDGDGDGSLSIIVSVAVANITPTMMLYRGRITSA